MRRLTPVSPPFNIVHNPRNSRFRRYLDGTNLVVEAVRLEFNFQPPFSSPAFDITGYDALFINEPTSGYVVSPNEQIINIEVYT